MIHNFRFWVGRVVALVGVILLAVVGAGIPAAATAAATTPTATRPPGVPAVLRVGTEGVYAPFSFHDSSGKLTGFDVEVITEVAKRLGSQVDFVETPWDSMFAALGSNRFDLVANEVTLNPERKAKYALSDPYVDTTGVLVVAKNSTITKLADIKGKTAAESITSNWSQVAKDQGATIQPIEGLTEAMTLLAQGRVDAVVNDKLAVRSYLTAQPNAPVKIVAETSDQSQSVFAAEKGATFMPAINQQIAAMKADGSLTKIYNKYFDASAKAPSAWQLMKDNAWPMLRALLTGTLPLTVLSMVLGLVIALGAALARMSRNRALSWVARTYISIIRGTPLLVQLFLIFYALPQAGIDLSPFPAAIIAFSLNVGGYAAEIIRAAIESIPRGQWEAASTVGMNYRTTLRRVILPQAARTAVPGLSNTLISLVKDTSLAATILVTELFRRAQIAAAPTYQFFAMYGMAALYYWIVCALLAAGQDRLEIRLNRFVAR